MVATNIINRVPTTILNNLTPYEIMFGKTPDYSHLRVFGTLCFASTLSHNRRKI